MPAPGRPVGETIAEVQAAGGVAVVPHPFQRTRHGVRKRRLKRVDPDAIETYNAWLFTGYRNRRARQYASRYGYPAVGGSDAHSLLTVGRAFTEIEVEPPIADVTSMDVVGAIRNGDTVIRGQRASLRRCSGHYAKAVARKSAWVGRTVLRKGGSGVRRAATSAVPFR